MLKRSPFERVVATILTLALPLLFVPAVSAQDTARLTGTVLSSQTDAAMAGVKLHAGDPATGKIYSSGVTGPDGSFQVDALPASTYELAVEVDGNFFVVRTPVQIAPGQSQDVTVAVNPETAAPSPEELEKKGGKGLWNNPLTAGGIVIVSAVLAGVLIDSATDDEDDASPSEQE